MPYLVEYCYEEYATRCADSGASQPVSRNKCRCDMSTEEIASRVEIASATMVAGRGWLFRGYRGCIQSELRRGLKKSVCVYL